jgi:multidrug efflux pump subunit AcrA (membrane-fusion protein)
MALEFDLDNQVITSQVAGFVDSLLVRCGDNVQAGQVVIRIVPKEVELRVVAFLSEAHRAWVNEGDRVKLELSQFPYAEFGTLDGKVISMGMDFASPGEVAIALGEGTRLDGPVFKVELEVLPRKDGPLAKVALKPGMLVDARFTLRRQSPISLVLKPLAQWLR